MIYVFYSLVACILSPSSLSSLFSCTKGVVSAFCSNLWDNDKGLWGVALGVVHRLASLPALDVLHDLGLALIGGNLAAVGITVSLGLEKGDQVDAGPDLLAFELSVLDKEDTGDR